MAGNHPIKVDTPLGEGLLYRSMAASERVGRLFEYRLELLSQDGGVDLDKVLGEGVTVGVELPDGGQRFFHGLIAEFAQIEDVGSYACYLAVLRPWLWFLTRTADCRIFQGKTTPEIIGEVFRDHGFTDFEERFSGSYRTWNYCVQYRETDFNFVSRLMEQEGMFYFFEHVEGKHTLVMTDANSARGPAAEAAEIAYIPPSQGRAHAREHISSWRMSRRVQPGICALNDYDFEKPKASLHATASQPRQHANAEFEIYDYPGEYSAPGDGEDSARVRIEELHALHEVADAATDVRTIAAGHTFSLVDFPREDQNQEYLVISASHRLRTEQYEAQAESGGKLIETKLQAIPASQPFRSERVTPKPVVQGPQTAVVVGMSGNEIWTDEYARVKVQFPWDRYGKADENSSCWVRVAQVWAGKQWGAIHIPRIGQEVIVEFLEGDPDRPIVTGRVYNGDNKPPYELPANQTQSGIKSRSSKGGGTEDFNELRFEDKAGSEEIYLHAQKDENHVVENDQSLEVGHDQTMHVGNDRSLTVDANKSESVGKNKSISVSGNHTESIAKDMTLSVDKNQTISVTKDQTESVDGSVTVSIGKDRTASISGKETSSVAKDYTLSVDGKSAVSVTKEHAFKAKKIVIQADDEIVLKTGSAQIQMKKNGDITIKGKKITVKGSGDVILKGSKVTAN